MTLIIDLTASEEAEISAAAKENGMEPADLVKKLVKEHLPSASISKESALDATLRKWQQRDRSDSNPNDATQALFVQWAEEDEQLTDEEREQNERVYAEIEKNGIPRVQI